MVTRVGLGRDGTDAWGSGDSDVFRRHGRSQLGLTGETCAPQSYRLSMRPTGCEFQSLATTKVQTWAHSKFDGGGDEISVWRRRKSCSDSRIQQIPSEKPWPTRTHAHQHTQRYTPTHTPIERSSGARSRSATGISDRMPTCRSRRITSTRNSLPTRPAIISFEIQQ